MAPGARFGTSVLHLPASVSSSQSTGKKICQWQRAVAGLVLFRLLWGIWGTHYARFSNFVRGPQAVTAYLRSLLTGRPDHYTGHNPAGAVAIVLMLAIVAFWWVQLG